MGRVATGRFLIDTFFGPVVPVTPPPDPVTGVHRIQSSISLRCLDLNPFDAPSSAPRNLHRTEPLHCLSPSMMLIDRLIDQVVASMVLSQPIDQDSLKGLDSLTLSSCLSQVSFLIRSTVSSATQPASRKTPSSAGLQLPSLSLLSPRITSCLQASPCRHCSSTQTTNLRLL